MTNALDLNLLGEKDVLRALPRYHGEFGENNMHLSEAFAAFAATKGCTAAQLAIAWVLAQGPHIIPIPGTKRRKYLQDNAGSVDVTLTPADFQQIEALLAKYPNVGDRYNEANRRFVDNN